MQNHKWSLVRSGLIATMLVGLAVEIVVGCSGAAQRGERTRALTTQIRVQVQWPAHSRVVPKAARLVRVRILTNEPDYDVEIGKADIVRPDGDEPISDQVIDGLPALVKIRIAVSAFPNPDGSGTVQAVSTQDTLSGASGSTTETDLTLGSTTARVAVSPASLTLQTLGSAQVTATSYDDKNNIVMTDPNGWKWTSTGEGASVDPTGNPVTIHGGLQGGTTVVTGTDNDSGRTVTVPVTVTPSTGPPGCKFITQDYGDRCSDGPHGEFRAWNCKTGGCEEPQVK